MGFNSGFKGLTLGTLLLWDITLSRLEVSNQNFRDNLLVPFSRVKQAKIHRYLTTNLCPVMSQNSEDLNYKTVLAVCRSIFPRLQQRLKMKTPVTPEFTALVTGHGKTKTCLHRFKLADDPTCPL